MKKAFDLFVFSSLFIACCAVIMVCQTAILFSLPFTFSLAGFVFCGTLCSYNFHWYLTPPDVETVSPKLFWNVNNKKVHLVLFFIGLLGAGIFAFLLIEYWQWLLATAFFTFLYSAPKIPWQEFSVLKKIALAKTIFLAFAWTHVTVILPMVMRDNVLTDAQIWFSVNRFFLIYAICILFDYRDREHDRRAGIRSMITDFSEPGIDILFWGSVLAFMASIVFLINSFSIFVLMALMVPVVLLAFLYYPSKKNFSDYHYYFVLDGLMMLSAPLVVLAKFAR